jgi:cytochrome oxidase Cu insertion factor (SCO1/SenC/PrrC family)
MSGPRAPGRRLQACVAKLVGSRLFWVLFVGTLFGLPLGRSLARTLPPAPSVLGQIEPFELEDQYGYPVSDTSLRGKMWVLAFASASGQAGTSFDEQRDVVYRTRNLGAAFRMITVTTKPEEDTREVRRAAVEKHSSSSQLWAFLGGSRVQVERATAAAIAPLSATEAGEQLFLFDRRGRLRGVYSPDKIGLDRLMQDLSYVANFPLS